MSAMPAEPSDSHIYSWIDFYPETLRFIFKALCFYRDLLQRNVAELELDGDLKDLMVERPGQDSQLHRELRMVTRMIEWHEGKQEGRDPFDYDLGSLSHGSIRTYKSICSLYLRHLQQQRNAFSRRTNLSKFVLEDIDTQLARYQEKLTTGVFAVATSRPLLVDDLALLTLDDAKCSTTGSPPETSLATVQQPQPRLLESIEVFDPVLRERCLDLFQTFREPGKHDRLDTVLADATRILEDRMRKVLNETGESGDKLAAIAFGGSSPKLSVSSNASEQQAVMFLFKAIFGHIRNPSHHKLLGPLSPERTLQVLGMIDYAVFLLENAAKQPPRTGTPPL